MSIFREVCNFVVRFEQPVSPLEIENMLEPSFEGSSLSVITITTDNQVRISTNYRIEDTGEGVDKEIEKKLYDGMQSLLGGVSLEEFSNNMNSKSPEGRSYYCRRY